MERVLSQDERIRRAEELYARRQLQNEIRRSATVNVENVRKSNLTRKLIIQCIVCLLIYTAFYTIKNAPQFASKKIMYKISDILEYDINVQKVYENLNNYINNKKEAIEESENEFIEETLSATENIVEQTDDNITAIEATENTEVTENTQENVTELSQMEIDADYIKSNFSLIKPLEGEITSRFGLRNPTVPTVPKNHTGIDIARVQGTAIIAAMDGVVELVSTEGDLR